MRRHNSAPGQLHLFETSVGGVTIPQALALRRKKTEQLCRAVTQCPSSAEQERQLQERAQAILDLSVKSPRPYGDIARGLVDIGAVQSLYDFSIGTEDESLMMVMDRERGSPDFMGKALQHAAGGKNGGAETMKQAWELLRILSTEEADNLTCAERLVAMHPTLPSTTPLCIRFFWSRVHSAYGCFAEQVSIRLEAYLPTLQLIANGSIHAENWRSALAQRFNGRAHQAPMSAV
ncbi:hypothetical protein FJZ27_04155 [Candidatus Peribacteria bacterium]|nr:hypothetical protein [Candidatus Peribacteria bacterium]